MSRNELSEFTDIDEAILSVDQYPKRFNSSPVKSDDKVWTKARRKQWAEYSKASQQVILKKYANTPDIQK